ncbi:hypothetical protein Pla163_36560 [Planctomycetes bacterium Pla163]|uniref:FG-GAP repeat protein n=1 Tax=Rohdeia mirabilis TaxID=2528008 RepID=A0A518D4U8_9BACT|nr:hypothetical protein Pla163_36560 [Planctomycetes bacterium Pla163]
MYSHRILALVALVPFSSLVGGAAAQTVVEDQRLTEPTLLDGDEFGAAVDTSQGRSAVGAPKHDGSGSQSGAVFLYTPSGPGWVLEDLIQSTDIASNDLFGTAVDLDGDRLVVGAPRRDVSFFDEGAAYEFVRQGDGSWSQTDRFSALDGSTGDQFGAAIAMDGDLAVVGAPGDDPSGVGSAGSAYLFERQASGDWLQIRKILSPAPGANRRFGRLVDIQGDRLVIGQDAPSSAQAGIERIFVYHINGDRLALEGIIGSPDPLAPGAQYFGSDLDLDGDRLIVGDPATTAGGRAFIYERGDGSWPLADTIVAVPEVSQTRVGDTVALHGDTAILGGPGTSSIEGRAVLYLESPSLGGWRLLANIEPDERTGLPPDQYASCVDLDDDTILIGAPRFSDLGAETGSAFALRRGMLLHGRTHLGISGGAQQDFLLLGGSDLAFKFHWIVGSASGTDPGVLLAPGLLVPLNVDSYGLSTVYSPGKPPLVGSVGLLDQDGVSVRSFVVPFGLAASLAGLTLHHAYLVYDPFTLVFEDVSNAVPLTLVP